MHGLDSLISFYLKKYPFAWSKDDIQEIQGFSRPISKPNISNLYIFFKKFIAHFHRGEHGSVKHRVSLLTYFSASRRRRGYTQGFAGMMGGVMGPKLESKISGRPMGQELAYAEIRSHVVVWWRYSRYGNYLIWYSSFHVESVSLQRRYFYFHDIFD